MGHRDVFSESEQLPQTGGGMTLSKDYLEALASQLIWAQIPSRAGSLKAGDRVVLMTVPPRVDELPAETQRLFHLCVDRPCEVVEVDANGLVVLDVGDDVDDTFGGFKNNIRVEPKYVRWVRSETTS